MSPATIHPAAFVDPKARLGDGVVVEPGALIGPDVRIGARTRIGSHALLTGWTTVGEDCRIHHGAVLGSPPQDLKYPGGTSYLEVGATTRVGSDCLLMAYSHVAHNCHIGSHVIVANVVQFAGYVTVEDWAIVGGGTVVHQFARIGCHSMIGGGTRISQDVAPYIKLAGSPPRLAGIYSIGLERRGFSVESRAALDRAYRVLFRGGKSTQEAVAELRDSWGAIAEVAHLARFAETSERGLTR